MSETQQQLFDDVAESLSSVVNVADQYVGIVKWFDTEKGFGFLLNDEGDDVFVHYSNILDQPAGRKNLREGEHVNYTEIQTNKGLSATEVTYHRV